MRNQLEVLPREKRLLPTKILLGVENAINPEFLRVLTDALQDVRLQDFEKSGNIQDLDFLVSQGLAVDPTFAAAKGARWRQEAPFYCVERDECEEERQREREGKRPNILDDEI